MNTTIVYNSDDDKQPAHIELGTAFISGGPDEIRQTQITFKTKFNIPPRISLCDLTSDPSRQVSTAYPVYITDFTIHTVRKDSEPAEVYWIAIGH